MKQVLLRRGAVTIEDVPAPALPDGYVLVRTAASVLSAGTERSAAQASAATLFEKALARPELVRQVVQRAAHDGVRATVDAVRGRLDEPIAVGYAAAGTVLEAGREAQMFKPGDLVACAGAGFANHAEIICVPRHLCVRAPGGVDAETAAFGTIGAIALHGVRLAELEVGATVAVIGMGVLGQLAAQLATASGCRVLAVDLAADRVALGRELGAALGGTPDDAPALADAMTKGVGVDAVLIAADTPSSDPVRLAGELARDRAAVVAIGAVGLEIPRALYYRKELKFQVSRSYGPGRYDPAYELEGHDYPIGYVRWTEERNLEAFLDLVARGRVAVVPLITHRFPVSDASRAFDVIAGKGGEPYLGVLLAYPDDTDRSRTVRASVAPIAATRRGIGAPRLGVLGAGSFAKGTLLPAFKGANARLVGIASRQGLNAKTCADRFGFSYSTTDEAQIFGDAGIDAVVIATRHHLHASQAIVAAAAGKDVFVEKPLCTSREDLDELDAVFSRPGAPRLMVGFNRRFAPLAQRLKGFFSTPAPVAIDYRVNAGSVPADHWTRDPDQGGGRIVGEACHFVDFVGWLVPSPAVSISARWVGRPTDESIAIVISFEDGSVATIWYLTAGDRALAKERIEVHGGSRSAVLDDFRTLELFADGRRTVERARQDKGHAAECRAFLEAMITGAASPIGLDDLLCTTRVTFLALASADQGSAIALR